MGRPLITDPELKRGQLMHIRISPREHREIKLAAQATNRGISTLVRESALSQARMILDGDRTK
jgi:uncharacterized protein (DUF1778 family)